MADPSVFVSLKDNFTRKITARSLPGTLYLSIFCRRFNVLRVIADRGMALEPSYPLLTSQNLPICASDFGLSTLPIFIGEMVVMF